MGFWDSFKEGYNEAINRKCPRCKNSITEYDNFCSKCGLKLRNTVCSECGAEHSENAKFCQECGAKVEPLDRK